MSRCKLTLFTAPVTKLFALVLMSIWAAMAQAQPLPAVSLAVPAQTRIGESFSFTASFDNTSAVSVGFGPFIDLVFPANGADGNAGTDAADGVDFVSATYLGIPVASTVLTFPLPGPLSCVAHPLAVDALGMPLQVCGTAGDKLVVLSLPFGSFAADQPAAALTINATTSNLADLGTALPIQARAGFQFGADALNNPLTDPSIVSDSDTLSSNWAPSASVTPTLISVRKVYSGPESETATGENSPRQYRIEVDIAAGQTITNLDVTDTLPNNIAFLSVVNSTPPGAMISASPPVGVAANPPNNLLTATFASVTGGVGTSDATLTFDYFVPYSDANGDAVLPPTTGDDALAGNQALAVGDWTPIDARDVGGIANALADPPGFEHQLELKSEAVQKSVAIVVGGPDANPGDTLEYTLAFQISDYFAFQNLRLADVLSDGQRLDNSFQPTLSLTQHGSTSAAAFDPANFSAIDHFTGGAPAVAPIDGTQEIGFRVSDELVTRLLDARVLGGCVPVGGTGGPIPDCSVFNGGATVGRITYRAVIQDSFSDVFPSGDPTIDHGDTLSNFVRLDGEILSTADVVTVTGFEEDDDSGSGVTIARGAPEKSVYAVNGVIGAPKTCNAGVNAGSVCTLDSDCPGASCQLRLAPGYTITYRLRYSLPSSDTEQYFLDDYLPLPVFSAAEVSTFDDVIGAVAPAAGHAQFGPADTFRTLSGIVPIVSVDAAANRLRISFGDFSDPAQTPTETDVLFTVTISDDPLADGLFLTNQLRVSESNTAVESQVQDTIVQVQLTQPVLRITKGVVSSDAAMGIFTPGDVGPQPFSAPGSGCPRPAGTINSTNLSAMPINSNLDGAQVGERVTFAIVIENTGNGLEGAFDVRLADLPPTDLVPTGFGIGGINLCISDGTGAPVSFTDLGGGLLGSGIELNDPGPTASPLGAIDPFSPTSGRNIIIVTYDLVVSAAAEPDEAHINTATLSNYAGLEGGADHTAVDLTDPAQVTTTAIEAFKSIVATSEASTTVVAGTEQVAIGEIARFRLTVQIPQSAMPNLQLQDLLPTGLTYLNDGSTRLAFVSTSGAISSSTLGGAGLNVVGNEATVAMITPTFVVPGGAILGAPFGSGTDPTFNLGSVTNLDIDADLEFIVLELNALVDNSVAGSNDAGDLRANSFVVIVDGAASGSPSNAVNLRVVEPSITNVDKTANPTTADAGDAITFTVTYSNANGATNTNAFDVRLLDVVPAALTLNLGSINVVLGGGASGVTNNSAANTLDVSITSFPAGGTVQITYVATINATVAPDQVITNIGNLAYTSLPGGNGTVVNPTGSSTPGGAGSDTGERDGAGGINDYVDSDPASVTIRGIATQKSIATTSEASTGVVAGVTRVALGEIVRYRLQTRIPEGTLTGFQLVDALPTGLIFLDDGTTRVAFVGNGGGITSTTIAGAGLSVAGNEATVAAITPTFVLPGAAITGDPFNTGSDPTFDLGTILNIDNDGDNEFVVLEFNALVDNSVAGSNDAGDNRSNTYRLNLNGVQSGATSNSVQVRVSEPSITNVDKLANPTSGDAGDTIAYTVTYSNATGANLTTAFDARILDVLPASVTLNLGSIVVTLGGGAAGFGNASAGNTLDVSIASVPAGGTVRIDYTVTLNTSVQPRQVINNTANLTYTSLPGANGTIGNPTGSTTPGASGTDTGERDGSGAINDYSDTDNATISVPDPSLAKALTATSQSSTDAGDLNLASNPPVAIGEILTYRLSYTLREGTTQGITLVDLIPSGLELVPGSARLDRSSTALTAAANPGSINANLPGTAVAVTLDAGTPGQLRLQLGQVTNVDTDNATQETYILTLQMVVSNIPSNNAGTLLSNTGRLEFQDSNGVNVGLNTSTVSAHVAEPIVALTKSVDSPTHSAGDVVAFDLVITNTAVGANAASAFNLSFSDTLPVQYVAPFTVALINVGGTGATVTASFTSNMLNGRIDQLDPGESVTISYEAILDPLAPFGLSVTNTAAVTATSLPDGNCTGGTNNGAPCINDLSCPGGGSCTYTTPGAPGSSSGERTGGGGVNDLTASDDAIVVVDSPSLSKTLLNGQAYYAIGASATFRITTGVPIGAQNSFVYTDVLPAGLSYTAGSLVVSTPAMTSTTCILPNPACDDANGAFFSQAGNTLTFNFGDIAVAAAGNITITYSVTVDNVLANQDGLLLVNTVSLAFEDANNPGNTSTLGPVVNDIPVRVGEPDLEISKAITSGAVGSDAGDTIGWLITLSNTGHTTAFQVDWRDVLPNGLNQISNVIVSSGGGTVFLNGTVTAVTTADAVVSTTTNANDTIHLPPVQVEAGATLTVSFDSLVMNSVTPGQVLNNTTRADYSSLVGGGRDDSSNPGNVDDDNDADLNNYGESVSQSLTLAAQIAITKSVNPNTYTVGQDVTYTIRVDFIEGTTPSLAITDILPPGLMYLSHLVSLGNAGIVFANAAFDTPAVNGQSVRFTFGDTTNPANGIGGDNFFTIALTARVNNIVANQNGVVLSNGETAQGSELYLEYGPAATRLDFDANAGLPGIQGVPITVVEPALTVGKTAAPAAAAPGQEVTYTINVTHAASSTADAFDLVLTDTLPAHMSYVPGSASLPAADVTSAGQILTFRIAALTLANGNRVFTYRALIALDAPVGQNLVNNIGLVWSNQPGATGALLSGRTGSDGIGGALNDYASAASASVSNPRPDLRMVKNHVGTFTVGGSGVYTLTINNIGAGKTTGPITVTDPLPNGVTYVSATGLGWTCGAVGQLVTCTNPGPLAPGVSSTITLTVNIGGAAYPTVNNVATVLTENDNKPNNNSDSDATTIHQAIPTNTPTAVPTNSFTSTPTFTRTATTGNPGATPSPTNGGSGTVVPTATIGNPTATATIGGPTATSTATATATATRTPTITPLPFLDVALTQNNSQLYTCSNGLIRLSVRNMGTGTRESTVGALTITDTLPAGLSFVSGEGNGWDCSAAGQNVTCIYPTTLAPNQETVVHLTVAVTEAAYPTRTNVAVVSTPYDGNSQNNSQSKPYTVYRGNEPCNPIATPTAARTATGVTVLPTATRTAAAPTATPTLGSPTPTPTAFLDVALTQINASLTTCSEGLIRMSVRNMGTGTRETTVGPLTITDTLPNGMTFITGEGDGWNCSAVAQNVTCVYPAVLAPNEQTFVQVVVFVDEAAYPTLSNIARVSTPYDGNPENNFEHKPYTVYRGSEPCGGTSSVSVTTTPTTTPSATPTPTIVANQGPIVPLMSVSRSTLPGGRVQLALKVRKLPPPVVIEMMLPPELAPYLVVPNAVRLADGTLRWTLTNSNGAPITTSVKVKASVALGITGDSLNISANVSAGGSYGVVSRSIVVKH